ncbi:MAG: outer membrane beta-barrel protein [Bacteroidetes bacterium]|nr:outer membrane beta-barrel protein [Bacteroidota bacterium]
MNKRIILLFILAFCFVAADLSAEEAKKRKKKRRKKRGKKELAFMQGQKTIQPATGFLARSDYDSTSYGYFGNTKVDPGFPIAFRGDYHVTDFLSAGAFFNIYSEKVTITDVTDESVSFGFKHNTSTFGIRSAFHKPFGAKIDVYGGIGLGFTAVKVKPFGEVNPITPNEKLGGFFYNVYGGLGYYIIKPLGVFVEVGYATPWYPMIQTGISLKF